jgi:Zn2+/Cd2+-exporting ATPase
MRKNGIKKIIMLTGDTRHTAKLVADQLGLDEFHAELLPENKVEYVKKLKEEGHVVAMAGDGIKEITCGSKVFHLCKENISQII